MLIMQVSNSTNRLRNDAYARKLLFGFHRDLVLDHWYTSPTSCQACVCHCTYQCNLQYTKQYVPPLLYVERPNFSQFISTSNKPPTVWTSFIYFGAPRYLAAFLLNMAMAALAIAFAFILYLYLRRENAKLDRGQDPGKNGPTAAQQAAGFRYLL